MLQIKNLIQADSLEQAYELNQKKSNTILGGMMWLKMGHQTIQTAIDLSKLNLEEIMEKEDQFLIGAMCPLRELELHKRLNEEFYGIFAESVKSIVGVQFRNGATIGGSVFGRFGFSDVITCLLCLDTYVELYKRGIIPLKEFLKLPKDRDILVRIIIKKDKRKAAYFTLRKSATDFPVIACAVSETSDNWYFSIGARPHTAALTTLEKKEILSESETLTQEKAEQIGNRISNKFEYGSNMRGSAEYRKMLAGVYIKRALIKIREFN